MRKRLLITGIVLAAVLLLAYFQFFPPASPPTGPAPVIQTGNSAPAPAAPNDLPNNMLLTGQDGSQFMAKSLQGKVILFFFQPDCDHCQREAAQISEHLPAFRDYSLYFISTAPMPQITQFAKEYRLSGTNVHFAQTRLENILSALGPIQAPSMFVYSQEGRLVQKFDGETDINLILRSI
jgi:peroxiredoxin